MKKLINKSVILLACLTTIGASAVPTFAEENKEKLYIEVEYSEDIEPKAEDVFNILCYNITNGEEYEISFDASSFANKEYETDLPNGDYNIEDVVYDGKNSNVSQAGYAITGSFTIDNEEDSIQLGIGYSEGTKIINTVSDYIVYQWGQKTAKLEKTNIAEESNNAENYDDDNDVSLTEKNKTKKEDVRQDDKQEKDSAKAYNASKKDLVSRGIPVIVLAAITSIIIYVLYKKGKIG